MHQPTKRAVRTSRLQHLHKAKPFECNDQKSSKKFVSFPLIHFLQSLIRKKICIKQARSIYKLCIKYRMNSNNKVPEKQRLKLFQSYWELGTIEKQRQYFLNTI